jgi:hypothetical protein
MPANMKLSERIPLGGGDILYSSTKSGGTLTVQREEPYMEITVKNSSFTKNPVFYLSNISYNPVGNFWQDQGYTWSHGYVNVTKGDLSVPLDYPTLQDVTYDEFTSTLFDIEVESYDETHRNCSILRIKSVNIRPLEFGSSLSGNGVGVLALNSTVKKSGVPYYNISEIQINTSVSAIHDTNFEDAMYNAVNTSLNNSNLLACSNIESVTYSPPAEPRLITIKIGDPKVMFLRQTTTILIGTQ